MLEEQKLRSIRQSKHDYHPFHIVDPSPWPFLTSFSLFLIVCSIVLTLQSSNYFQCAGNCPFGFHAWPFILVRLFSITGFMSFIFSIYCWLTDIITESVYQGKHTWRVSRGLRIGFSLFIVSEVMLFFSFFWAFFTFSLNPSIWIGGVWPSFGLAVLDPLGLPLTNTMLLLTSAYYLTIAHWCVLSNLRKNAIMGVSWSLLFAILFVFVQALEYLNAKTFINDSSYGSIFYLITGFHGIHVIIGALLIFFTGLRFHKLPFFLKVNTLFRDQHVGFQAAVWYWHFVDVIWFFVWSFVYSWGGRF